MGGEYTDVRLSSAIEPPAGADAKKRPSAPARGAATITARLTSRPSADGLESEPCATFFRRRGFIRWAGPTAHLFDPDVTEPGWIF